jgi:hypothetical protein
VGRQDTSDSTTAGLRPEIGFLSGQPILSDFWLGLGTPDAS